MTPTASPASTPSLPACRTDRRGWRQEWDNFDEDIQDEVRETHVRLILHELTTYPKVKALSK